MDLDRGPPDHWGHPGGGSHHDRPPPPGAIHLPPSASSGGTPNAGAPPGSAVMAAAGSSSFAATAAATATHPSAMRVPGTSSSTASGSPQQQQNQQQQQQQHSSNGGAQQTQQQTVGPPGSSNSSISVTGVAGGSAETGTTPASIHPRPLNGTGGAPGALNTQSPENNKNNNNSSNNSSSNNTNNNTSSNSSSTTTSASNNNSTGGGTGPPPPNNFHPSGSTPGAAATLNYTATPGTAAAAMGSGTGGPGTSSDWGGFNNRHPHNSGASSSDNAAQPVLLSKSPMPEFWCSILYFELDTQVKSAFLSLSIRELHLISSIGWRNVQSSERLAECDGRWIRRPFRRQQVLPGGVEQRPQNRGQREGSASHRQGNPARPRRRGRRLDPVPVRPLGVRPELLLGQRGRPRPRGRGAQDLPLGSHKGKIFKIHSNRDS